MARWERKWLVLEEAGSRRIPGFEYLLRLPQPVRNQLIATVDAVRTTGPDRWFDRQSHAPMRANLDAVHEARDKHGDTLYRLFLRWQRDDRRVVVLDGRTKANRTAIPDAEYAEIERLATAADSGAARFATEDDFAAIALRVADTGSGPAERED